VSQYVYSSQKSGFVKGRAYLNPRFFDGTLQPGATSVVVVGEWPKVVEAYKAAGIPVAITKNGEKLPDPNAGADNVSTEVTTEHKRSVVKGKGKDVGKIDPPLKDGNNVEIPANFQELPFKALVALAAQIDNSPKDFASKKEVVEFLEQYAPSEKD
jgi:uncharacterized phage protein gp47/JayE